MKFNNVLFSGLLSLAMIVCMQAQSNVAPAASGPIMSFENTVVDYGKVIQNSDPLRVAKFTNTGTEPLIITSARGSCGCTVPDYPKQPIMPGETAQIEIRYATDRLGQINKTVTITTNEGGEPHVLKVVGEISPKVEEEGVPAKKNSLIKQNNND